MELIKTNRSAETAEPQTASVVTLKMKRKERYCEHKKELIADEDIQMLCCDECGQMVSPWEFVWGLAKERWSLGNHKADTERKIAELIKRLEELKREEVNVKARIRSARKSA